MYPLIAKSQQIFFFWVVVSVRTVQMKISKNANFPSPGPSPRFGCSWIEDPKGFDIIKGYFWLQHQDEEVQVFWTHVSCIFKCWSYNCLQMCGTYFRNTQKARGGDDQRTLGLILEYHIWRRIFKNTFSLHFYFQRIASTSCGDGSLSLSLSFRTLRNDPSAEAQNSATSFDFGRVSL